MGPFDGSFVVTLRENGGLSNILKIHVLTPFDQSPTLQLSCLLRPRSRPRNPTLLTLGAKQSFLHKIWTLFLMSLKPAKCILFEN